VLIARHATFTAGPAAGRARLCVSFGLLVVLAAASNEASAAALGSLATSVGLLAALAAMIAIKGWSANAATGALSSAGGVLALAAGALLMWRMLRSAGPSATALLPWRSSGSARGGRRRVGRDDLASRPALDLPAGMDSAELSRALCDHFVQLQAAWDARDVDALAALSTPGMLEELRTQLCEYGSSADRTEVRALDALLLGYEERERLELVCVEFSGLMRESAERGVVPFRELWMLERSKQASDSWKLARQQTLL